MRIPNSTKDPLGHAKGLAKIEQKLRGAGYLGRAVRKIESEDRSDIYLAVMEKKSREAGALSRSVVLLAEPNGEVVIMRPVSLEEITGAATEEDRGPTVRIKAGDEQSGYLVFGVHVYAGSVEGQYFTRETEVNVEEPLEWMRQLVGDGYIETGNRIADIPDDAKLLTSPLDVPSGLMTQLNAIYRDGIKVK